MMPFSQAFTWAEDGLLIKNFMFWVLGKIGQKPLIQAIAAGTVYGAAGYLVCESTKPDYRKLARILMLVLAMLPMFLVANNVRNMLTFALQALALYRDLVKKKKGIWTIFLYIAPCFIHMTGIAIVLVRVLLPFIKRHYKIASSLLIGVPFLATSIIYPRLRRIPIPGAIGLIVRRGILKLYTTVVGTSSYAVSTRESGYNNACRIVMFFVCALLLYATLKYLRSDKGKCDSRYDFLVVSLFINMFTCVYDMTGAIKYWVFAVLSVLTAIPLLSLIYRGEFKCRILRIDIRIPITMLAICRLCLEIYFTSSRVNWNDFFSNVVLMNGWRVIGNILIALSGL